MENWQNLVTTLTITVDHQVEALPSSCDVDTIGERRCCATDISHIVSTDFAVTIQIFVLRIAVCIKTLVNETIQVPDRVTLLKGSTDLIVCRAGVSLIRWCSALGQ